MHALNFGIGGDQIQNVLWRIHNGELDHIKPKVTLVTITKNYFRPRGKKKQSSMDIMKIGMKTG